MARPRYKRRPLAMTAEAIEMFFAGVAIKDIAAHFNTTTQTTIYMINKYYQKPKQELTLQSKINTPDGLQD